jgi:putative FmdB family regulatory protein
MPLYDYRCESCRDFREIRPMSESSAPRMCPICGAMSERMILTPFLAGNGPGDPRAHGQSNRTGFPHRCGHGHGCSHSHDG